MECRPDVFAAMILRASTSEPRAVGYLDVVLVLLLLVLLVDDDDDDDVSVEVDTILSGMIGCNKAG